MQMKSLTLLPTFYTLVLFSQSFLALANAQSFPRKLGTIQAKAVGNGNGNRGDSPTGPVVPGLATNENNNDFDADGDGEDDDTIGTPGFWLTDDHVTTNNVDGDDNTAKPGIANDGDALQNADLNNKEDDDSTPASPPVPAFFQSAPSPIPIPSLALTAEPSAELSDTPSSTPTQTAVPTVTASDAPSSIPTKTPSPTIAVSDAPSSTPTLKPSPTIGASDLPSSTPTALGSDLPSSSPTSTLTNIPTSGPSALSTSRNNQSPLLDPITRFLRPFAVRLSVKESNTATDEEIRNGLKLFLEQLLEIKLGLVFSDLTNILLDYVAPQARSDGSELYSFTGKGFFDSTPVTAPSHAALQAAQMKVLSDFLFELEEMLKDNDIEIDTVVIQISNDLKQEQGTNEKSSGAGQQDVTFPFDGGEEGDRDDPETIVLGVQDEPSGSSSVYIVIASTLSVSLGLILLGIKRGFGSKETEAIATRQPRGNVMVVDANVTTNADQSLV